MLANAKAWHAGQVRGMACWPKAAAVAQLVLWGQQSPWALGISFRRARASFSCPEARLPVISDLRGGRTKSGREGGGTNRSDAGLNLSGSWQQGHSATYNTPSRI